MDQNTKIDLLNSISHLPRATQVIIIMTALQGYTQQEVARELGISQQAVCKRLKRKKVKKALKWLYF